ncbi:hypothetical protein BDP27DRAFT_139112 [Rhodocollybia butyracea]|uniref:t-SNARE coiled-coil homology domain-containing protein n=1 Tax=Rhodocollybia butyracea TaxID=206335 RepID=A0A9P5Q320_9AGAR|nr:hypothetical protein BDP27DRAFT_139112 [Rhodocollybia butyracea]
MHKFFSTVWTLRLAWPNAISTGYDIDGMRSDMDELRNDTDAQRIEVDGVRNDLADSTQGIREDMRMNVDTLRRDVDGVRGDIEVVRGDVDAVQIDMSGVKDDIDTIHGDVAGLQGDIGNAQNDVDGLRLDFIEVRRDIDDLMVRYGPGDIKEEIKETTRGKFDEVWTDINRVRADMNTLQQQLGDDQARGLEDWDYESPLDKVRARLDDVETKNRSLWGQVGDMKQRLDSQEEEMNLLRAREDSTAGRIQELQGMVDEILKIKEKSTAELETLTAARIEAENELRIVIDMRKQAALAAQAISASSDVVHSSLKRKRADESDDLDHEILDNMESSSSSTISPDVDGLMVPTPKRARRIARARRVGTVVAQTAVAVTIGAAAAWTALAFS